MMRGEPIPNEQNGDGTKSGSDKSGSLIWPVPPHSLSEIGREEGTYNT